MGKIKKKDAKMQRFLVVYNHKNMEWIYIVLVTQYKY